MDLKINNKNDTKKSSLKNTKIKNIDEQVDRILLQNKEKLTNQEKTEFNQERISLKNKDGKTIFLRNRSKDNKIISSSDTPSSKTIFEDKTNRYKKQNEADIKIDEFLNNINKTIKQTSSYGFDKKKEYKKENKNLKKTDDLVGSKEFDKVISEIEKKLDQMKLETTNDIKKIYYKKLIENIKLEDNSHETKEIGIKSPKTNKKYPIISKNKTLKNENKKTIDWVSQTTDDLAELKKQETQKKSPIIITAKRQKIITEKDVEVSKGFFKPKKTDDVSPVFDQRISEAEKVFHKDDTHKLKKHFFKTEKVTDDKSIFEQRIPEMEKVIHEDIVSKEKKHFFKHKKVFEDRSTGFEQRIPDLEKIVRVEDIEKPEPKKHFFKLKKVIEDKSIFEQKTPETEKVIHREDIEKPKPKKRFFKSKKTDNVSTVFERSDFKKVVSKRDASKPKKHLFKPKNVQKIKSTISKQKNTDMENIDIKSEFHVENISFDEELNKEGTKLIDKKITESQEKTTEKSLKNDLEIKANKLAEEHIKNNPAKTSLNKEFDKKSDTTLKFNITDDKESEPEHVFFNEESSPHYGWSSQAIEKEKNKEIEPTMPQDEIGLEKLEKINDIELPKEILSTNSVKLTELGFSENDWEELDFYALHEPFAYVEILRQRDTLDKCYFLVEIALTEEEENLLAFMKDTLVSLSIDAEELEKKGEDEYLYDKLDQIIDEYNQIINNESKKKLFYFIGKSCLGLGKINPLMKDPNIEDISCDGARVPIFLYHRKYGSLKSNIRFENEDELSSFVFRLAQKCGKHISIAEPMLDATMPDGSRIQMTLSDEITAKGSTFTIRKFRSEPFSPIDLIEFNTMSTEMIAYMWVAVENGINTLFAGGTASGKTTTLNAIMLFIPRESKIVSIEETREINLPHPNWIPGVSRTGFGEIVADKAVGEIDTYDLMKAALRQRPEYIIVGEIRGKEAYVLFQAMATGHATYSTAHADSAQSLIHRLEGKPINIPRIMLQSLDLVCIHVITSVKNMRARRCKQIIEIIDIDPTTKEILTNEVFHWDPVEDKFIYSGKSYILERIRTEKDLSREDMETEISNRKKIIEWMNTKNIRGFRDVANTVSKYMETPGELLTQIKKDENK